MEQEILQQSLDLIKNKIYEKYPLNKDNNNNNVLFTCINDLKGLPIMKNIHERLIKCFIRTCIDDIEMKKMISNEKKLEEFKRKKQYECKFIDGDKKKDDDNNKYKKFKRTYHFTPLNLKDFDVKKLKDENLKSVRFNDLRINEINFNCEIELEVVIRSIKIIGRSLLAKDLNGDLGECSIYNSDRFMDKKFVKGVRFIVKHPYYKVSVSGNLMIRVDDTSRIKIISENIGNDAENEASKLEAIGKEFAKKGDYFNSVLYYQQAFEKKKTLKIFNNIILCFMKMNNFEKMDKLTLKIPSWFDDANKKNTQQLMKFCYLQCLSCIRNGKFVDAKEKIENYSNTIKGFVNQKTILLKKLKYFKIQKSGKYDFWRLLEDKKIPEIIDFHGPYKIQEVDRIKGRGCIATRDIKKGETIMVVKALCSSCETAMKIRISNFVTHNADLTTKLMNLVRVNKGIKEKILILSSGKINKNHRDEYVDDTLITDIISSNAFAIVHPFKIEKPKTGSALFYEPSFINHSCEPNCIYYTYRDIIVVSSLCNIRKNEEITVSYIENIGGGTKDGLLCKNIHCTCDICLSKCEMMKDELYLSFVENFKNKNMFFNHSESLMMYNRIKSLLKKYKFNPLFGIVFTYYFTVIAKHPKFITEYVQDYSKFIEAVPSATLEPLITFVKIFFQIPDIKRKFKNQIEKILLERYTKNAKGIIDKIISGEYIL